MKRHPSRKFAHTLMALFALASAALAQSTPIGPGTLPGDNVMVNSQKAGSVLFYLYYESSSSSRTNINTRINITNTHLEESAFVHIFLIASCTPADAFLCLTPSQTASFTALDFDPDSKGWILAVAVDGGTATTAGTGCPVNFNWLIGDEYLNVSGGFTANLGAEAVASRFASHGLPLSDCTAASATATLAFNGTTGYDALGGVLAVNSFPSLLDKNAIRMIIQSPRGNLAQPNTNRANVFGGLYDDAEQLISFTFAVTCQNPVIDLSGAHGGFPRILSGGLNQWVGIGRTGWMRFWEISSPTPNALLGAIFINNTEAGINSFSGGHLMHKLTLNGNNTITIPILVPTC